MFTITLRGQPEDYALALKGAITDASMRPSQDVLKYMQQVFRDFEASEPVERTERIGYKSELILPGDFVYYKPGYYDNAVLVFVMQKFATEMGSRSVIAICNNTRNSKEGKVMVVPTSILRTIAT